MLAVAAIALARACGRGAALSGTAAMGSVRATFPNWTIVGNNNETQPRAAAAHADGVDGRDEECGVLAHEAEHGCDAVGLDVLRQHFVGGNGGMVQRMLPV